MACARILGSSFGIEVDTLRMRSMSSSAPGPVMRFRNSDVRAPCKTWREPVSGSPREEYSTYSSRQSYTEHLTAIAEQVRYSSGCSLSASIKVAAEWHIPTAISSRSTFASNAIRSTVTAFRVSENAADEEGKLPFAPVPMPPGKQLTQSVQRRVVSIMKKPMADMTGRAATVRLSL